MRQCHHNHKKTGKQQKATKPKRHTLRNIVGLSVVGGTAAVGATVAGIWGGWQYVKAEAKNRRRHTPAFNKLVTANTYCGTVHKDGERFTLTTAGGTYHIVDPLAVIDKIAHAQLEKAKHDKTQHKPQVSRYQPNDRPSAYYDVPVCVVGDLSQKGRYGYLGQQDYQLTVVEAADM